MIYERNGFYHLYNRGHNKETLFYDEDDYQKLMEIIRKSSKKEYLELIAFSLKQNHYHMLVKQISDKPVTSWIQYIFNTYAKYYNKKYNKKGAIFEARVKGKRIKDEYYLFNIVHYINDNPASPLEKKYCSLNFFNDELLTRAYYIESYESFENYIKGLNEYRNSKESKIRVEGFLFEK